MCSSLFFSFDSLHCTFLKGHSSRLAALDYTICAHGEVFVTTQGGNFPHFLMGHRRYMYDGHAKTIKPDKRKMVLYLDNPHIRLLLLLLFTSYKPFHELFYKVIIHNELRLRSQLTS